MGGFDDAWLSSHQQRMAGLQGQAVRRALDTVPAPAKVARKRPKPSRLPPEARVMLLAERRPIADEVVLSFTLPPSVNKAWRNIEEGKGRVRSDAYKSWISSCCTVLCDGRIGRVDGPYSCLIEARRPKGTRGALRDVDNLIKPMLDVLKNTGMTPDDRHCMEVTARWAEMRGDGGVVVVLRKWRGIWTWREGEKVAAE